jgi:hypothetical protein
VDLHPLPRLAAPGLRLLRPGRQKGPRWRLLQLESNHLSHITSPDKLAAMLLKLAAS